MRAVCTALVILSMMGSAPGAPARPPTPEPIRWDGDVQAALTRARYSGRATVVLVWSHWCGYCEQVEKFFLAPEAAPLASRAVLALADVAGSRDLLTKLGIRQDQHHQVIVVSWDGRELARVGWPQDPKEFYSQVAGAIAANDADAAKKLFEMRRYRKSAERARSVLELVQEGDAAQLANQTLNGITQKANASLELARKLLADGRWGECRQACDRIAEDYPDDMVATGLGELRKLIDLARKGKALPVPAETDKPEPAQKARELVDRGMVLEWEGSYLAATETYEQAVRQFPDQKPTQEARERLNALRKNPKTADIIRKQEVERDCRRMLNLARAWTANGRTAEARAEYERLIKTHPDNDSTAQARKELEELDQRK